MARSGLIKFVQLNILLIAFITVSDFFSFQIGNTYLWWVFEFWIVLVFWKARFSFFDQEYRNSMRFLNWYLLWNVFNIVRGVFAAQIYWDYKFLIGNTFVLLLPIVSYSLSNKEVLQSVLSFYVKFVLPFYILLLPFLPSGALGLYLCPISFLMLFFPALTIQGKGIVLLATIVAILSDLSTRSYLIKYGIPLILLLVYYLRYLFTSVKYVELLQKVFMVLPWLFFILAVSGTFNVFNMNSYMDGENYVAKTQDASGKVVEQDVTTDSRTFLYLEALNSAIKYKYWLIGRTPARGHETKFFADADPTGRGERIRDEVGILNVFTWTGIIGVILYFLVFFKASYIAIKQSNNIYSKMLGLFVAARWMYAWVEDINMFDLNYFTIWLMIGLCFSESFRKMDNAEVTLWARGIFGRRYFIRYKKLIIDND